MRYIEVQQKIEQDINSFEDNQILPSERNLSLKYDCSRETLRKALENLKNEGKIFKSKNIGWFTNRKKIKYDLKSTQSFYQYTTQQGFEPHTEILSKNIIPANSTLTAVFGEAYRHQDFIEIIRLRFINDIPVLMEYNYLPHQKFEKLLDYNLEQSIAYIVEDIYQHPYLSSQLSIKNSNISELEKSKLLIPPHQSAIKIERISSDKQEVIELDIEIWRDDKIELILDIYND